MRKQYEQFRELVSGLKVGQTNSPYFQSLSQPFLIAGPCALESKEQAFTAAKQVKAMGGAIFRAGAFKPRTSPYSFQGLGLEGLHILKEIRQEVGIPIVTEIMDVHLLDHFIGKVDVLQIGSRNMQNFSLLKAVGQSGLPVILKRGISATLEEYILAAEYIVHHGNSNVCLCERGVRGFDSVTRNMLDLSAVAILKELTSLPVIVDPSHGTGVKSLIGPMSRAAIALGANGLMIEMHPKPEQAMSDKEHALSPVELKQISQQVLPSRAPHIIKESSYVSHCL